MNSIIDFFITYKDSFVVAFLIVQLYFPLYKQPRPRSGSVGSGK